MIQIQPEYLIVLGAVLLALGIAIGELEAHWRRQRVRKNPFQARGDCLPSHEVRRAILGKLEVKNCGPVTNLQGLLRRMS